MTKGIEKDQSEWDLIKSLYNFFDYDLKKDYTKKLINWLKMKFQKSINVLKSWIKTVILLKGCT